MHNTWAYCASLVNGTTVQSETRLTAAMFEAMKRRCTTRQSFSKDGSRLVRAGNLLAPAVLPVWHCFLSRKPARRSRNSKERCDTQGHTVGRHSPCKAMWLGGSNAHKSSQTQFVTGWVPAHNVGPNNASNQLAP